MTTLVVTAHPDTGSLTHDAARLVQQELGAESVEVAHLAQERFDPRFTLNDRLEYLDQAHPDPAVVAEQRRLDRADDLVLVFPVYWWSMPALLKGWIDRVFIGGWAFDYDENDRVVPRLQRLTAHLLPLSGTSARSFARHGYTEAFDTQINHGIVDFCGIRQGTTAFVHDSESEDRVAIRRELDAAVAKIVSAIAPSR